MGGGEFVIRETMRTLRPFLYDDEGNEAGGDTRTHLCTVPCAAVAYVWRTTPPFIRENHSAGIPVRRCGCSRGRDRSSPELMRTCVLH